MSEIKVNSIKGVGASTAAISIDNSSGSCTANISSVNGGQLGNRNIIINGEHKIDQRNNGSAVTVNGGGFGGRKFVTDRFSIQHNGTATVTGQQVTDTPAGYKNSLKMTVATAESAVDAADYLFLGYRLEGNDASVLECGTSDAKEFTVSFWVKSSITGTYTLSFANYSDNRSHRKEYTISSANTWEHKTVTLTADTTGTWFTNNSGGLNVTWMLLGGSNSVGAANTWTGDIKNVTSNQTQWASTLGATFFITAIQLELGSVATEFEHKPITQDLALSQRYFQTSFTSNPSTTNTDNNGVVLYNGGRTGDTTSFLGAAYIQLSPLMRTAPTVTIFDLATPRNTGKCHRHTYGYAGSNNQDTLVTDPNPSGFNVRSDSGHNANGMIFHWQCEAEL